MNARMILLGLALTLPVSGLVQADEVSVGSDLMVHDAWIRAAPPNAPVRAGYARLMNHGDVDVVIDGVRSDDFGSIEIHEMHEVDGVMRMRPVKHLRVAPHGSVALEPGGLHLMLFQPRSALATQDGATLVFLHGDTVLTEAHFVVTDSNPAKSGADEHDAHSHHELMHEH